MAIEIGATVLALGRYFGRVLEVVLVQNYDGYDVDVWVKFQREVEPCCGWFLGRDVVRVRRCWRYQGDDKWKCDGHEITTEDLEGRGDVVEIMRASYDLHPGTLDSNGKWAPLKGSVPLKDVRIVWSW